MHKKLDERIERNYRECLGKQGVIKNAQGLGIDIFHVHENDEVEITGYFILQAFNYLDHSKDEAYLKEIFPMLEWAWNFQVKNLVKSMLPFNGDETYVAGAVLPRYALNDGSAEATLLFITSGNRLIQWVEKNGLWEKEKLKEKFHILDYYHDKPKTIKELEMIIEKAEQFKRYMNN